MATTTPSTAGAPSQINDANRIFVGTKGFGQASATSTGPRRNRRTSPFGMEGGERDLDRLGDFELLVLPDRIELSTSPLPRECSTTELRQRTDIVDDVGGGLTATCHPPLQAAILREIGVECRA